MSRALTRQRIIDVAIALADREGFDAVTLRRVAAELDVHVTSLYNHVDTRDHVIDGMVQRLVAEADLPVEPLGWEEWVRCFFWGMCDVAVAHPGAFEALQYRPAQGEEALLSFEIGLEAFSKAGMNSRDAYGAVKATVLATLGVGTERAVGSRGDLTQTDVESLPPERFPHMRLTADIDDNEPIYVFVLETLLSGLRSQLRRRRESRRATSSTPGIVRGSP